MTTSLPLSKQLEHDLPSRFQAADQMRDDFDFRIVRDLPQIGRKHAGGKFELARFFVIAHHDRFQHQPATGVPRSPFAMLDQQPRHAGADGAHADDGDFGLVHRLLTGESATIATLESAMLECGVRIIVKR